LSTAEERVLVLAFSLGGAAAQSLGDAEDIDVPVAPPAPKPSSEEDDWGFDQKQKLDLTVDDDEQMKDFVAEKKTKAPPPVWFHLDVAGKMPLRDDYEVQIDAYNQSFVVVELPVLVSITRGTFATDHPNGIRLVAEVTSGPLKRVITETITPDAVFEALPTFVFFKTALPTAAPTGEIRYVVKSAELPAPPAATAKAPAPPPPPAPLKDLFARTTVFRRP
jgi:hypothetical protein